MEAKRLSPETARKLAKVLGMLGSDNDGQRAAAALQAHRLAAGLDWGEVLDAAAERHRYPDPLVGQDERTREAAAWAEDFAGRDVFTRKRLPEHCITASHLLSLYGPVLLPAQEKFLKRIKRTGDARLSREDDAELRIILHACRRAGKKLAEARERWERKQAEAAARRQREHRERHPRPRKAPVETACAECGGAMTALRSTRRYCSATCRSRAHLRAKGDTGRRAA